VPRRHGLACRDARAIKLADLQFRLDERFLYEYDLRDGCQLQVRLEHRSAGKAERPYPVCVGGRWAGSPEDCGAQRLEAELGEEKGHLIDGVPAGLGCAAPAGAADHGGSRCARRRSTTGFGRLSFAGIPGCEPIRKRTW